MIMTVTRIEWPKQAPIYISPCTVTQKGLRYKAGCKTNYASQIKVCLLCLDLQNVNLGIVRHRSQQGWISQTATMCYELGLVCFINFHASYIITLYYIVSSQNIDNLLAIHVENCSPLEAFLKGRSFHFHFHIFQNANCAVSFKCELQQ